MNSERGGAFPATGLLETLGYESERTLETINRSKSFQVFIQGIRGILNQ
jgi:hypothetical protein